MAFSLLSGILMNRLFPLFRMYGKQLAIELRDPELPHQVGARHPALADTRLTRDVWNFLSGLDPTIDQRRPVRGKAFDLTVLKLSQDGDFTEPSCHVVLQSTEVTCTQHPVDLAEAQIILDVQQILDAAVVESGGSQ